MAKLKIPIIMKSRQKSNLKCFSKTSGAARSNPLCHSVIMPPGFFDKGLIFTKMGPFQKMVLYLNFTDGENYVSISLRTEICQFYNQ